MYAVWIDVIVVCQYDFKIKLFNVLVRAMSNFFFGVYIFEHSLEYHFEYSTNVLGNVSVIFSIFYVLPDFFLLFLQCHQNLKLFCQWQKTLLHYQMEKQLQLGGFHLLFLFISLFRQSNIFILILICSCFCRCCCFSFSCPTISSVTVSSSSAAESLSEAYSYTTFLYFFGLKYSCSC